MPWGPLTTPLPAGPVLSPSGEGKALTFDSGRLLSPKASPAARGPGGVAAESSTRVMGHQAPRPPPRDLIWGWLGGGGRGKAGAPDLPLSGRGSGGRRYGTGPGRPESRS